MATKTKKKPAPAKKKPAPAKKKPAPAKKAVAAAPVVVVDDSMRQDLEAARADVARLTGELQAARAERDRIRGDGEQAAQKARGQIQELEKLRSETLKGSVDLASATRKAEEANRRADEATRFGDETSRQLATARAELGAYKLRCPKCGKNFVEEDYEGITIDRCTGCDAVYFDAGEVDQLIAKVHEKMTSPSADAQQTSGWFKKLFKRKPKGGEPTGGETAPPT